jgi:hypothetical protein
MPRLNGGGLRHLQAREDLLLSPWPSPSPALCLAVQT